MGLGCSCERPWSEAFATSPCLGNWGLLVLRVVLALSYLAHAVYDVLRHFDGGFYYFLITHWSLTLQAIGSVLLVPATLVSIKHLEEEPACRVGEKAMAMPFICRLALVMFSLELPLSLMVVIMYWTLDNPIWTLPPGYTTDYDNLYVHGIQW
eukprot:CAMPEP_0197628608 /NCGR_PEP_ID=MMETSP1338-20131121/6841_1 /TAXON_ID=43686 ORGANISM="Pelagodinium beii, Strain RCC1491" /NCGR_SAMPLE_ID=MMETSP1338 /ASSEMBLY_ACC=CAM_ASM_000754 /LENGTH=152 /DNA_ID=CAMNT_0043199593 /DNA_START=42 /DNA_END=497 /DNA_ORIENTATION=-